MATRTFQVQYSSGAGLEEAILQTLDSSRQLLRDTNRHAHYHDRHHDGWS